MFAQLHTTGNQTTHHKRGNAIACTFDWLRNEVCKASTDPLERLMAIFDVFNRWFQHKDFEGCSLITVLREYNLDSPMRQAAAAHLAGIRSFLKELASEARLADIHAFSDTWHILKGSIVAACEGKKAWR